MTGSADGQLRKQSASVRDVESRRKSGLSGCESGQRMLHEGLDATFLIDYLDGVEATKEFYEANGGDLGNTPFSDCDGGRNWIIVSSRVNTRES
jgi:hypothetical protein